MKAVLITFFFYLGFLSRPIASHRTGGERGRHFFSSSLPLPLASPTIPSKHLLVLKTSWRSFQHVFSVIILRLPRRLEDALKTFYKTSWRRLGRRKTVSLKTSSKLVLKTSWRHYGDKQMTYWVYLYLTYLRFTNLYLTILRRIQNLLIRTHHFNICLILQLKQHLYFKN